MDFTVINQRILYCGKTGSGKSLLLRYMLDKYKHEFRKIYLISPTERINNFYKGIVRDTDIFENYNESWMNLLIKKLTDYKQENDKSYGNVCVILDDVVASENLNNSKSLKTLLCRGRHINITVLITVQYINLVSPVVRNNSSYIICGKQNKLSVDLLADYYISGNLSRSEFIKMFNENTNDYNFLIINCNNTKTDDVDEYFGTIKCPKEYI